MLHNQPLRPICSNCNIKPARSNGISARGFQRWHKYCGSCAKLIYTNKSQKKDHCDVCGFKALHSCQLDQVDSRTVCANCHRLEIHDKNNAKRSNYELTVDATVNIDDVRL